MEIIRQGHDPALTPVQATCNRCDTAIRFFPHEAKYVSDQRDGDFYQIKCPTCGNNITASVRRGYNGPG